MFLCWSDDMAVCFKSGCGGHAWISAKVRGGGGVAAGSLLARGDGSVTRLCCQTNSI